MEKSRKKNSEKLFLLKVCLPIAYEEIGDVIIEAVERGWAVEQDFNLINNIVGRYVKTAKDETLVNDNIRMYKKSNLKMYKN
ncbi:MAG: hypothetical protein ACLUWN_00885, partial [Clostridia bacterium]